jgi:hypothetical protein
MFIDPVYATVSSRTSNHSADLAHEEWIENCGMTGGKCATLISFFDTYNLFPVAIQKICNNNKNRLVIDMYTCN